jgi:hypothetical protein
LKDYIYRKPRAVAYPLPLIEVCRKRTRIPVTTTQGCVKMPHCGCSKRGIAANGEFLGDIIHTYQNLSSTGDPGCQLELPNAAFGRNQI